MSDIRKWLKIMESVSPILANHPDSSLSLEKDTTVTISPAVGGGTGRFVSKTPSGALIDIKGIVRELADGEFSASSRENEDPYQQGNDWFHSSVEQDTIGTMNDKPEFRSGDLVKVADVYGSVIGPGFGVFIAYGTTGQDCVVSFDDEEIVVPIEKVAAVLEQGAKDNFSDTDNDGNLSPMSLASDNVKTELDKDTGMNYKDEFSAWLNTVREALESETASDEPVEHKGCECGNWDCEDCFPSTDVTRKTGGQNSPMTYGDDNLDEGDFDSETDDDMHNLDYATPVDKQEYYDDMEQLDPDDAIMMISSILYMQETGLSNASKTYTEQMLSRLSPAMLKKVYTNVTGNISETANPVNEEVAPVQRKAATKVQSKVSESLGVLKPTLYERIKWDEEIKDILKLNEESDIDEAQGKPTKKERDARKQAAYDRRMEDYIIKKHDYEKRVAAGQADDEEPPVKPEAPKEKGQLARRIANEPGGRNLIKWLHGKHRLSNDAELEPVEFSKELLWTQFKKHPDDFVIVSGTRGVAGIKPSAKHIEYMTKKKAEKGQTYNPGGDSTLPYQIIAFTEDGKQVNPALLRPASDKKDSAPVDTDPTVQKARMGKSIGKDLQNQDNTFRLLADQIGSLKNVWITGFSGYRGDPESVRPAVGSVDREKMAKRAGLKKDSHMSHDEAVTMVFNKVRPVLKTLAHQALSQLTRTVQRYMDGGNFEGAQKLASSGQKIKQLLVALDKSGNVALDMSWGSSTKDLGHAIEKSLSKAAGAPFGSEEYEEFIVSAARGNSAQLGPVLDGLRDTLVGL